MLSKKGILVTIVSILFVLSCGGGGSDDSGGGGGGGTNDEFIQSIIDDYVDNVVIPTYDHLRERSATLREACEALEADPTEESLEAAREAWFAARIPWEQSESWLFGPVDFKGHDPALDSWPVNRTDLDAVLSSDAELTEEFVGNLDPTLKGFHTAEYLLFAFDVDELGAREFEYLISVVRDIESTSEELYTDWAGGDEPFGEIMKGAGNNSVFPSQVSALEQIIEGMSIILDEVANGKIAEPFDNQDVEAVESQFSFNSRQDFANDVRGALHAYTGDHPGLGLIGTGLDELVAESDPELAQRMEDEINDAIDAILAIPQPFRDAILDPDAADEIVAAQEACRQAFDTLNNEVLPVIQQ
ncbi:MAG: imelysin family protein [Thermodesulfobacteriota bacterium]